jgi:hypothetical protein
MARGYLLAPKPETRTFLTAREAGVRAEVGASDTTPEALQAVLAETARGTALIKDELAGFLEFDRYRKSGGEAARALYLSSYDDAPCMLNRKTSDSGYIRHTGLAVFGGIQPERLAAFKQNMAIDGLLQRFVVIRTLAPTLTRDDIKITGLDYIQATIFDLCKTDAQTYTTTPEGCALIRRSENLGTDYASITDYSEGWPGFCRKLHGTHARLALLLHLYDHPAMDIIPEDTINRAGNLVHQFVLPHARDFYATLPGSNRDRMRDIAGWLLTRDDATTGKAERILASDLTSSIRSCRSLSSKCIGELLDAFVVNGWLVPETDFPNNRSWFFKPTIRAGFTERAQAERQRKADIRAMIDGIGGPWRT